MNTLFDLTAFEADQPPKPKPRYGIFSYAPDGARFAYGRPHPVSYVYSGIERMFDVTKHPRRKPFPFKSLSIARTTMHALMRSNKHPNADKLTWRIEAL